MASKEWDGQRRRGAVHTSSLQKQVPAAQWVAGATSWKTALPSGRLRRSRLGGRGRLGCP